MTTQPTPKAKPDPLFFALALITLALSSWGLFHLFVDFAAAPWWLAASVIGGLDLAAVLFGKHALTVSADGDSPALWNLLLLAFTALAARVQYNHAMLADWPQIIGVTMAAFPVATVLLFEGQLRRVARVNGRAQGSVAAPRRKVPLLVWIRFPRRAWSATSQAILAQGHLEETTLNRGDATLNRAADAVTPPRRRARPVKAIEPAPNEEVARNGHDRPQTVAAAVRDAKAIHGDNRAAVIAAVRDIYPEVSADTLRKTLARTNGHAHA